MRINIKLNILLFSLLINILFTIACQDDTEKNKVKLNLHDLESLLENRRYQEFYEALGKKDIKTVRKALEKRARKGQIYNYGVLVNAQIITNKNKKIFKPKLRNITEFSTVPNNGLCYLNSALYNIANNSFFDDVLEIDKLFPRKWQSRDAKNIEKADKVLSSLRELIYEIRLGTNTMPKHIDHLREQHVNSFAAFYSTENIANIYRELLFSYDFDDIYFHWLNLEKGKYEKKVVKINFSPDNIITDLSDNFIKNNTFGQLGAIGRALKYLSERSGSQDAYYLSALLAIIDPWGLIARYLTAHAFDANTYSPFSAMFLRDDSFFINGFDLSIENNLAFAVKDKRYILRLIHNSVNKHKGEAMLSFRDPTTKKERGRISSVGAPQKNFILTAKSRHNHNHQIAEIFRYSRKEWETHSFFSAPSFAKKISEAQDSYKDYLYFYKRHKEL